MDLSLSPTGTLSDTLLAPSVTVSTLPGLASLETRGIAERLSLLAHLEGDDAERYVVGNEVGRGGMGVVHSAADLDLGREIAVKHLKEGSHGTERFLREAQITGQLDHPGIVPVHDLGYAKEGGLYYVMRLVQGGLDLRKLIGRLRSGDEQAHESFSFERRVRIVQQVAQTLHFAHTRGVIHRDVKPENVLLGPLGEVYLVDWGVARLSADTPEETPDLSELGPIRVDLDHPTTQEGALIGTPLYMAPEQFSGQVTSRSDVYSLCALLYELLSLRHYLGEPAETFMELVMRAKGAVPAPAESFSESPNGRVPRALSLICERGLAKDPAERFASALELEEALETWLEGRSPVVCGTTGLVRSLHAWRRAVERAPQVMTRLSVVFVGLALLSLSLHALQLGLWLANR
ncbi:MAG: serine/threonine protein kinase [Planctomycetes bacterium]|nr:serine/threonine protein kinase [Planctomycetota bacterium]